MVRSPCIPSGISHVTSQCLDHLNLIDDLSQMILHDWSDDHCVKLLKNCFKVLPDNGKVIVADLILPVKPDTSFSSKCICQADVIMMTQNPGGKERSENEVRALAIAAGFRDSQVKCRAGNLGVIEIYK